MPPPWVVPRLDDSHKRQVAESPVPLPALVAVLDYDALGSGLRV
jgi:hypothetical protein